MLKNLKAMIAKVAPVRVHASSLDLPIAEQRARIASGRR